eukprot:TRINITY_DN2732_c0_g1_i4.p2 TRINITY_DN2732_c0_g1~~TRINITY_DN2732_c0_g1_i4.p2  ORF type:complete len:127 (+),score=21.48 TRINITY_DN2732_c0_g1_i4:443-823(+)
MTAQQQRRQWWTVQQRWTVWQWWRRRTPAWLCCSCLALLRAREYLSKLLVDSLVAYASDARASALCRKRAYVWADLEVWEADGLRLPAEGNISGNWVRCTDALLQHNNVGLYWSTPGKGLAECVHS